jgi:hypothetical protein
MVHWRVARVLGILLLPAAAQAQVPIGPLTFAGYVQPDGLFAVSDDPFDREDTFRIRRARFTLGGELTERVEWEVSAELTASPALRDAAVTFKPVPWLYVRAGQFVTPYSLERMTSNSRIEAIERTIGDALTPSRDMGFEISSGSPLGGWLSYGFAVVNGTGQNVADVNDAKDVVGRLSAPIPGARWLSIGVNAATGEQPVGRRTRYGSDVEFKAGSVRIVGEFLRESVEGAADRHGLYVLARHRRGAAEFVGRFSRARLTEITRRRLEVGGNYYFTTRTRLMTFLVAEPDLPGSAFGIATRMQFGF